MYSGISKYNLTFVFIVGVMCIGVACHKSADVFTSSGVASFTVVNAIPNSQPVIPVFNTTEAVTWFFNAASINYGEFYEYSPIGMRDTLYIVQSNSDTLNLGPKATGFMFYNILDIKVDSIYSLFLTGTDTSSPDYLLTTDAIPYYPPSDSIVGIRFVNLSTGSNPISINLEGSPKGSEIVSLPYKGITSFKQYANNSATQDYFFVVRDATSGDSLAQFDFLQSGSNNNGFGLTDPTNSGNNGRLLTFRNVTVAIYGLENNVNIPMATMLVDDY